jgi:hypothetical protein
MTLQKANEKRIENFLAKQIRHNGKILSMREFMDSLIADGYSPRAKAEQKVGHPSSRQTFRWNNEQQREHQIKRALGGTVLKYSMVSSDGSFYDIEKIAYDYVIEKMGGVNVKPETMCFAIFNSPSSLRGGKRERCVAVLAALWQQRNNGSGACYLLTSRIMIWSGSVKPLPRRKRWN